MKYLNIGRFMVSHDDFEEGKQMYHLRKKRPPTPSEDDECTSPQSHRWLGWMMARATAIAQLHNLCKNAEISTDSKGYERCLRVLDMQHGLSPFRHPLWSKED